MQWTQVSADVKTQGELALGLQFSSDLGTLRDAKRACMYWLLVSSGWTEGSQTQTEEVVTNLQQELPLKSCPGPLVSVGRVLIGR